MIDGLTFKFTSLQGQRTISGARLTFRFDVFFGYNRNPSQPHAAVYYIDQGRLNLKGPAGDIIVGTLHPEFRQKVRLANGGTWSHGLHIDLSDSAVQQLIENSGNRIFKMYIDTTGAVIPETQMTSVSEQNEYGMFYLYGTVNGAENREYFQVPVDMWANAIIQTKVADYRISEIVVASMEKPHTKPLLNTLKEAETLYNEGKYDSMLLKIRAIAEWAGHKTKGEEDRYPILKKIDLDRSAIPYLKNYLDFIWDWTSEGLHFSAGSEKSVSRQQAKFALDVAYSFVAYISKFDSVGIFANNGKNH